jgi:hypothetical protein
MMGPVTTDAEAAAAFPSVPAPVLRPSRQAYARAVKANLWIAIPLLAISLLRVALNPWLLVVFVVAIAATFGGVLLYFRNTKIEFGGGQYRVTNMVGSARGFAASDAATLVTIVSLISASTAPPSPQLLLTRPDGSKLLRLRGQTWEVAQFTELANDLIAHGVVNDALLEPITTAQLRARYPRLIGWWEAHPFAFGLIVGLGIVVVIAVVVAVFFASYA